MKNKNEKLVPIEKVIDDMYQDKGLVSLAARDYYYLNYATESERKDMDFEDKIQNIISTCFFSCIVVMFVFGLAVEYFG